MPGSEAEQWRIAPLHDRDDMHASVWPPDALLARGLPGRGREEKRPGVGGKMSASDTRDFVSSDVMRAPSAAEKTAAFQVPWASRPAMTKADPSGV
jgi:hypothetical protein